MYDTVAVAVAPNVVEFTDQALGQQYVDQVALCAKLYNDYHLNEAALSLVGVTLVISLWKYFQQQGKTETTTPKLMKKRKETVSP